MTFLSGALLLSGALFAADLGDPSAWRHPVQVPENYCYASLRLETAHLGIMKSRLSGCEITEAPGVGVRGHCSVPAPLLQKRVNELSELGTVIKYDKRCAKPTPAQFHRERESALTKELAALGLPPDSAVSGLATAELEMLRWALARHEAATSTASLSVTALRKDTAPQDADYEFERATRPPTGPRRVITVADGKRDGLGRPTPWIRTEYPWCEQVEMVTAHDYSYGGQSKTLARLLEAVGPAAPSNDRHECPGPAVRRYSRSSGKELLEKIRAWPGVQHASIRAPVRPAMEIFDDVRHERLSSQLEGLKASPALSALVRSELARVGAAAEKVREARGGVVLEMMTHGAPGMP